MWYFFCFVLGVFIGVLVMTIYAKVMLKKKMESMKKMYSQVNNRSVK